MENQCSQIMMFRKQLKNRLSPMRYEHSLSVSFTCMSLAMRYGYDMNKAELAGLMHDCGKRFSDEVILKKCLKHGIPVTSQRTRRWLCCTPNMERGWRRTNIRYGMRKF